MKPKRIYLAGKVSHVSDWRLTLLKLPYHHRPHSSHSGAYEWKPVKAVLPRGHDYAGPFLEKPERYQVHGSYIKDSPLDHGGDVRGKDLVSACFDAIRNADAMFCWITEQSAYGTLVEIGYALALGKPAFIAGTVAFGDLWFALQAAKDSGSHIGNEAWAREDCGDVTGAFGAFLDELEFADRAGNRSNRLDNFLSSCESPIEKQFAAAAVEMGVWDNFDMAGQHPIVIDGKRSRLDFAFPKAKIAVEIDGHNFHEKTVKQSTRDKSRDRRLAGDGWTTLRFTGSEVFANATECVAEVLKLLHARQDG